MLLGRNRFRGEAGATFEPPDLQSGKFEQDTKFESFLLHVPDSVLVTAFYHHSENILRETLNSSGVKTPILTKMRSIISG